MFIKSIRLILVMFLIHLLSVNLYSRNLSSQFDSLKVKNRSYANSELSIINNPIIWPSHYGIQQTGKIDASFNDQGQFGEGFYRYGRRFLLGIHYYASFESPPQSNNEYLFGGGIWVGAVLGEDTLVSTSVDGWTGRSEFGFEHENQPNVEIIKFQSDRSMRTEFTDTTTEITNISWDVSDYKPLDIRIVNRSHVWKSDPLDNAIFYDYLIDYIGDEEKLDSVYIGFYFDCDVSQRYKDGGYYDDIAGSLRENGIAYIIDNDGDPTDDIFTEASPTKAFAFKLLASSFTPTDTNFNWWSSSGYTQIDYGPRLREDSFRNFGTGGLGTPMGDANKYYMLRHKEWDYDQIYMHSINYDDSIWIGPTTLHDGSYIVEYDPKFLYSIGPITLEKRKPERIIFATYTADSIHTITNNLDNIPEDPIQYIDNLNLENLITVGNDIQQAVDLILDPMNSPTGLEIYDYNKIRFDPYVFDDVTEYEVYATPIDLSALPIPRVLSPMYKPSSPIHIGSSIDEIPLNAIDGVTAINVAYKSEAGISELSGTKFINFPSPPATPITKLNSTTTTIDSIVIEWVLPDSSEMPDHYKIYKYADSQEFFGNHFIVDSIEIDGGFWHYQRVYSEPYAIIPSSETSYTDFSFEENYLYVIASVDEYGIESDLAATFSHLVLERSKDFLILTNSDNSLFSTMPGTIINFYKELLDQTEFSYDIYSVKDSIANNVCTNEYQCPSWQLMNKYRCVIVDESEFQKNSGGLEIENYISNGGKFVYFGVGHNTMYNWHPAVTFYNFLGIDSIYQIGPMSYMLDSINVGELGFNSAKSIDSRFPTLECDTSRYPLDSNWLRLIGFPLNEPLSVSAFIPSEKAQVTHTYKSLYPTTSILQDRAVGVLNSWQDDFDLYEVFSFGFHLYYMDYNQSRDLLRSILLSVPTDIVELDNDNIPTDFMMSQNYPNPFNPTSTIEFSLPVHSDVKLTVYNLLGQQVKELTNKNFAAGSYKITWDGTNTSGDKVSSGIYLYRLETNIFSATKKMVLLK